VRTVIKRGGDGTNREVQRKRTTGSIATRKEVQPGQKRGEGRAAKLSSEGGRTGRPGAEMAVLLGDGRRRHSMGDNGFDLYLFHLLEGAK